MSRKKKKLTAAEIANQAEAMEMAEIQKAFEQNKVALRKTYRELPCGARQR